MSLVSATASLLCHRILQIHLAAILFIQYCNYISEWRTMLITPLWSSILQEKKFYQKRSHVSYDCSSPRPKCHRISSL